MPEPRFAVVLEEFEVLETEWLATVLAEGLNMVRYDAVRRARDARGIVAERITGAQADQLVAALAEGFTNAFKLPQEQVITIGKPNLVRLIKPEDDALHMTVGYTAQTRPIPWDRVVMVSAGELIEVRKVVTKGKKKRKRRSSVLRMGAVVAGGLPGLVLVSAMERARNATKASGGKTKVTTHTKAVEVCDLFAAKPDGSYEHVRLKGPDLYYPQILGQDAVRADPYTNFRLVLGRIVERASSAVSNPGLRALLGADDADPADAQFGLEEEFSNYNRWLLQMVELERVLDGGDEEELEEFELVED